MGDKDVDWQICFAANCYERSNGTYFRNCCHTARTVRGMNCWEERNEIDCDRTARDMNRYGKQDEIDCNRFCSTARIVPDMNEIDCYEFGRNRPVAYQMIQLLTIDGAFGWN